MVDFETSTLSDMWFFALITVVNVVFLTIILRVHKSTKSIKNWRISNLSGFYVDFGRFAVHQSFASFVKRRSFDAVSFRIKESIFQILDVNSVEEIPATTFPADISDEMMEFLNDPLEWRHALEAQERRDGSIKAIRETLMRRSDPFPKLKALLTKAKLVN